jgi:hypothetical protein
MPPKRKMYTGETINSNIYPLQVLFNKCFFFVKNYYHYHNQSLVEMVPLFRCSQMRRKPNTYFSGKKYRHMIVVKDTQLTVLNDVKKKMKKLIKKYI